MGRSFDEMALDQCPIHASLRCGGGLPLATFPRSAMRSWLWSFVLLAPLAANAQVLNLSLRNGADAGLVNASQCDTVENVNFQAVTTTSCSDLVVWATAGSCGDHPDAGDPPIGSVTQANLATPAN